MFLNPLKKNGQGFPYSLLSYRIWGALVRYTFAEKKEHKKINHSYTLFSSPFNSGDRYINHDIDKIKASIKIRREMTCNHLENGRPVQIFVITIQVRIPSFPSETKMI